MHLFLSCKAEFSASLLQSLVSLDPSEINLCSYGVQETFLFVINIENTELYNIFEETMTHFFKMLF